MKLPRNLSGSELVILLRRYGYETTRQTGSHQRVTSTAMGHEHHVSVPLHSALKVGTLSRILADVADYVQIDKDQAAENLFT